jgi:DNA-binding IclR family transcriptional regulator
MSTISKALELLQHFSSETPEIGLSELSRLVRCDKATVYRHLSDLEHSGFVEQNPVTRRYRLGPAVLPLSRLRETTLPRGDAVKQPLCNLAQSTDETAHASLFQDHKLITLAQQTSQAHSTRVVISEQTLPLHATGSGLAVLAFADDGLSGQIERSLAQSTDVPVTTPTTLKERICDVHETGFGVANQSFETGIYGIGAAVFDDTGRVAGAIAVAAPVHRMVP